MKKIEIKLQSGEKLPIEPRVFYANPYFDEILCFFRKEVPTSQDKYKPYKCANCGETQLYIKRDKANKTDFVNEIQGFLLKKKNSQWPFTEKLLLQFGVTDIPLKVKEIDLDNLAKTICDSLKGIVYKDDSQIVSIAGNKHSMPVMEINGKKILPLTGFMIAVKRLRDDELGIYQNAFYSADPMYMRDEREEKQRRGMLTRFIAYTN